MQFLKVISVLLLTLFSTPSISFAADSLSLSGGQQWLVFASKQDATEAVQLAESFQEALQGTPYQDKVRVVRSENGWFGVVVGPVNFKNLQLARQQISIDLPEDAYLSHGRRSLETVWPARNLRFGEFEAQNHFSLKLEKLRVDAGLITEQADPNDEFSKNSKVQVVGWIGQNKVFSFETEPSYFPQYGQSVQVIRLAKETEFPQVVIKRFTGGAHCCVEQQIITQNREGSWVMVQGAVLDGGYGYSFEDLDGDGTLELVSADNSFFYLFAPYAGSFAPLYIEKLYYDEITDVNMDPVYLPAFRKELAYLEELAGSEKSLWGENGFLAGWAALRARLGDGMEAVAQATERSRSDQEDFWKYACPDGSPSSECDYENAVALPFPVGLTVHLIERGYLPVQPLH